MLVFSVSKMINDCNTHVSSAKRSQDTYHKVIFPSSHDTVTFTSNYKKEEALKLIVHAETGEIQPLGQGFQSAFYKLSNCVGIKMPRPLYPNSPAADLIGDNNIKEFLGLKLVNDINPEIAVNPIDLIEHNNKNYLVMDLVSGKHPFEVKFNNDNLEVLTNNLYELDINGIAHSDLQNANIFISSNQKPKLIDFGSYSTLLDDGSYISSDDVPSKSFKDILENNRKLSNGKRIIATFANNNIPLDLKNYSDNSFLKIKSNLSNFEFRTVYDYIKQSKAENPKEFLKDYLKTKAECYHKKMENFLERCLPSDLSQLEQCQNAIKTERLFADIFSNPSENVMKTELAKIQLKWLINDYQGNKIKAYNYYLSLSDSVNSLINSSSGIEKSYFEQMKNTLSAYKNLLNKTEYKGGILSDNDNLVKIVFNKIIGPTKPTETGLNKKLLTFFTLGAAFIGLGIFIYKKFKNKANVDIGKQTIIKNFLCANKF